MDTRQCLEILELESINSPEELRKAYRRMVKIWHPDRFHGDAHTQQKAEGKLKEINQAYKHLLAYFDPEERKRLKSSNSAADRYSGFENRYQGSGLHQRYDGSHYSNRNGGPSGKSYQFDHHKASPAPKQSFFGRLALVGVICFFIAISCLVGYFILNMDRLTAKPLGAATEALEEMKKHLEEELITKTDEIGNIRTKSPAAENESSNISEESKLKPNQKYFEIYLEGGTIITTQSWWYEGDMVMYQQFGGSMGVEKTQVVRIVERTSIDQ